MRMMAIKDFLTDSEVKKCMKLKDAHVIYKEVILPNWASINEKIGGENHPMFVAYAVEYAVRKGMSL